MIRVLFVNTRSQIGADVAVHLTIVKNLDPARCEVTVATNRRAVDFKQMVCTLESVPGVRIVPLNLGFEQAGKGKAGKLLGAAGNIADLALGLMRLVPLVRSRRVDIIHSTDRPRDALLATLLAKLTGRKNVIHVHIGWTEEMARFTAWASRSGTSRMLAISQFIARTMTGCGIPASKVYTALNSTDAELFDPAKTAPGKLRAHLGLGADVPLVGIVARIMVWKGHLQLVEAMALVRETVPSAHLVIIGTEDLITSPDSYAAQVRSRIAELGLERNVSWAGWFDDMPAAWADIDVACVPSREEPFGLVVTEAMAMERPVVAHDSGALREIVDDGVDGLLVPVGDVGGLARAITRLLNDPAKRREMGRKGRQKVLERFTPRRQADEVAAIYETILARQ